ncbi:MAG: LysR family transcriptional regulator, partial [Acidimicrobiia bacterium]|nr:LysR family transcriptional regulator [Acidimicrobiia bacterium]
MMVSNAWPGLEVRHLAALVAVAEELSFSRAADRLGYTQSGVSQQIAALERIVGTPLFERPGGPRRVALTEAGALLRAHAEALLSRVGAAEADLRALVAGEGGTLRVGTFQSTGTRVLPDVLQRFRLRWPDVTVSLLEATDCHDLLALVEAGELDLAFTERPDTDGPFTVTALLDDAFVFVCARGADQAVLPAISLDEVARLPLIGNRNDRCQANIEDTFRSTSVRPTFVFRSDDNATVQACIAAGLGVGLLPWLTVEPSDPAVAVVPVDPAPPPRQLAVVSHEARRLGPAAEAFVALALT